MSQSRCNFSNPHSEFLDFPGHFVVGADKSILIANSLRFPIPASALLDHCF